VSRLNIELFRKIRDRIAAIPESYDQSDWVSPSLRSPCGVAACLAGEAIICNAPTVQQGVEELNTLRDMDGGFAISDRATELLGLSGSWRMYCEDDDYRSAGDTLIFDSEALYWPLEFAQRFQDGEESEAVVAYLDWIIANGKVLD